MSREEKVEENVGGRGTRHCRALEETLGLLDSLLSADNFSINELPAPNNLSKSNRLDSSSHANLRQDSGSMDCIALFLPEERDNRPKSFLHDEMSEFNQIFNELTVDIPAIQSDVYDIPLKVSPPGLEGTCAPKTTATLDARRAHAIKRNLSFERQLSSTIESLSPTSPQRRIYDVEETESSRRDLLGQSHDAYGASKFSAPILDIFGYYSTPRCRGKDTTTNRPNELSRCSTLCEEPSTVINMHKANNSECITCEPVFDAWTPANISCDSDSLTPTLVQRALTKLSSLDSESASTLPSVRHTESSVKDLRRYSEGNGVVLRRTHGADGLLRVKESSAGPYGSYDILETAAEAEEDDRSFVTAVSGSLSPIAARNIAVCRYLTEDDADSGYQTADNSLSSFPQNNGKLSSNVRGIRSPAPGSSDCSSTQFSSHSLKSDYSSAITSMLDKDLISHSQTVDNIQLKIDVFNSLSRGGPVMSLLPDGIIYQGFIRVHLYLYRPVNQSLAAHPASTFDILRRNESKPAETKVASFYVPENTSKVIHVTSLTTTEAVISSLLGKFNITDAPDRFALYEKTSSCELSGNRTIVRSRRLRNDERPLEISLSWVNHLCHDRVDKYVDENDQPNFNPLDYSRFVLQDNEKGQIEWDEFSLPELNNFLLILDREEKSYVEQIQQKYTINRRDLMKRLAKLEQTSVPVLVEEPTASNC